MKKYSMSLQLTDSLFKDFLETPYNSQTDFREKNLENHCIHKELLQKPSRNGWDLESGG